ncbi:MocR-like pyridoxine biosynthesis transcription factor PdxR [Agromyces soli]
MPRQSADRPAPVVAWETLFELRGEGALRDRLERVVRTAVSDGRLPAGAALPPSRALAEALGVSRWVVTECYGQLVAEGVLEARVGAATRVAGTAPAARASAPAHDTARAGAGGSGRTAGSGTADAGALLDERASLRPPARRPGYDLGPGVADLRHVPRTQWAGALRHALQSTPDAELAVVDRLGHPRTRTAVADYLRRSRHVDAEAGRVVVTHGATEGMAIVVAALRAAGHRALLVEDPSWARLRGVAQAAGLTPVPVPVDGEGVDVEALERAATRTGARAALITPAHQFPLGVALSAQRREAIVRWARRIDGLVVEDDYDAEFRYDRRPIAALQRLDPERVALVGSLSKSIAPALGLGWAVLPTAFLARFDHGASPRPSVVDQLALARFIEHGELERHLRRARQRFRRRRERVLAALSRELPGLEVSGIAAGMHLVLALPPGTNAAAVHAAAEASDLAVAPLTRYRATAAATSPDALVVGYGNLADPLVDEAVAVLARIIRSVAGSTDHTGHIVS